MALSGIMDASELELITLNYMVAAAAAANSNLSKIHSNFGKINITTTTTGLRVNGKGHARTLLRRVIFVKMDRSVTGQDIKCRETGHARTLLRRVIFVKMDVIFVKMDVMFVKMDRRVRVYALI